MKVIRKAGEISWTIWRTRWGQGADVDVSGYLYTIATVGMTFAGLSVLTMILRQMLGGHMTKFDSFVARTWVELGFMITFGSILPPLLGLFEVSALVVWRISSGLMAIVLGWWALTFPRRRLVTNRTRLPISVIDSSPTIDLIALAPPGRAIAASVKRWSGVYAASVT